MHPPRALSYLVGGCVVAIAAQCSRSQDSSAPAPPPPPALAVPSHDSSVLPSHHTIADVAARATPSVVNVFSERKIAAPPQAPSFADPFRFFFNPPGSSPGGDAPLRRAPERERSLGSGVIVSADGVILTNSHVVYRADKVRIAMQDGRELDARIVGTDPQSDIAVLRVDARDLPAIPVADSSQIRTGDLVLAIGNPFGLGQTVTMGIISAVGRANIGITDYEDFIQTDAAINPGNSGGALVDMDGKLVGINTAIASRTGGYQGIGFAIPSAMALQVERALLDHGKVTRGWLGVASQDITDELARSLDLKARHGVVVSDVAANSPAAKAGVVRGDVIVAVDGSPTDASTHLRNLIALAGKGKRVRVDIERRGKPQRFEIVLGELPTAADNPLSLDDGVLEGVTIQPLDRPLRDRLRVPGALNGMVITRIDPNSAAAQIGLRAGDVIVEANRQPVPTLDAFRNATRDSAHGVLLLIYRDGATIYMSLSR